MQLTEADQLALTKVLDFHVPLTRKKTPALRPLSFYSSELKGTKQIAGTLKSIRDAGIVSENEISRERYFNTLWNQGLVEGTATEATLTPLADYYLVPLDNNVDDSFWQGDEANEIELKVIRVLADRLSREQLVSDPFKAAWYWAQEFFDYVPTEDLPNVLADREKLLFLSHINANGWEIGRYFGLSSQEQQEFERAFEKVTVSEQGNSNVPIEIAASKYKDAAKRVQADVRFRISGFLNAYNQLRVELGAKLPRLDREFVLRAGTDQHSVTHDGQKPSGTSSASAAPLQHPHQLIVTGCPGSGKSFYMDQLAKDASYVIRTQFHAESSFFDFVGAFKPHPVYETIDPVFPLVEGDGRPSERGKPRIDYRYVAGPLMQGIGRALTHPNENVVVLIEELNRGNAAAILGDILQLLDRKDDGESRYGILATAEQRAYFFSINHPLETIRLPRNLYLWATMNNADQGVYPLDTAFRRRWSYVYKGYSEPCRYRSEAAIIRYGGGDYFWDTFRSAVNVVLIQLGVHEDKLIGPYFLTEQQLRLPEAVLEKLFLYLWDDALRFRQDALFSGKSFSEVAAIWNNGAGAPLNISLPAPSTFVAAEGGGESAASPTSATGREADASHST